MRNSSLPYGFSSFFLATLGLPCLKDIVESFSGHGTHFVPLDLWTTLPRNPSWDRNISMKLKGDDHLDCLINVFVLIYLH